MTDRVAQRVTRHMSRMPDGRLVHYRRCGSGPAVVLLHGSPQWSGALVPLMQAVAAQGLCALAPDTPGNGCSDALTGEDCDTGDYASALGQWFDAVGLGRVGLYGFHTGATIAAAFAAQQPGRVTRLVLDGLPVWTEAERAALLADYLPPFAPVWDGAHLTWLWARLEEQAIFFPWHGPSAANRMAFTALVPETVNTQALEFLRAGDAYRMPYRAAFTARGETLAAGLRGDARLVAREGDPLLAHLDRLPPLSEGICVERLARDAGAAHARYAAWLAEAPGDAAPEPSGFDGFVATGGQQLRVLGDLGGTGRPLVLLHDAGGSSALFATVVAGLTGQRPVVALDLPGHGESGDDGAEVPETVAGWADAVEGTLDALGLTDAAVAGFHLGGQIAVELARRGRASMAGMIGAPVYGATEQAELLERYVPDLSPSWDGGHLVRAWRMMRAMALFYPWYRREAAHALPGEPRLDVGVLHRRTVDVLKAGGAARAAYAAQFRHDTAAAVAAAPNVTVLRWGPDPLSADERVAGLGPVATLALPDSPARWGGVLGGFGA